MSPVRRLCLAALALIACDPAAASNTSSTSTSVVTNVRVESPKLDFELKDFDLTDHKGRPFKKADMAGKVWIADFIFTSCPSICPGMTRTVAKVADDLKTEEDIRFLSITVDPENDTPEKLDAFFQKHGVVEGGAPSSRWFFVTGEPKAVDDTILKSFLMAFQRGATPAQVTHAERLVLVDKQTHVRALFDTDAAGIEALEKQARAFAKN